MDKKSLNNYNELSSSELICISGGNFWTEVIKHLIPPSINKKSVTDKHVL